MRIFVLSGQSNMAGRGGVHHKHWDGVVPPECAPDPSILRLSSAQQWEEAREPLHADIDTTKTCGIGPGMAFARAVLSSLQEDTPGAAAQIGLVPCAVGGTAIREWSLGKHLYEQMVSRARVATLYGEIEAILWYQGESDAESDADTSAYLENVERLICNVRADLGMPQLPFIQGGTKVLRRLSDTKLRSSKRLHLHLGIKGTLKKSEMLNLVLICPML
uniref:Sialate O-acetylesterase domain-containing protein n=1 Tax=Zea mays TaxID=4577 RepID=A0A804MI23_MAIZE